MKIRHRWGRWSRWAAFELICSLYHQRGFKAPDSLIRHAYGMGAHGRCRACDKYQRYLKAGLCRQCQGPGQWEGYEGAREARNLLKSLDLNVRRKGDPDH